MGAYHGPYQATEILFGTSKLKRCASVRSTGFQVHRHVRFNASDKEGGGVPKIDDLPRDGRKCFVVYYLLPNALFEITAAFAYLTKCVKQRLHTLRHWVAINACR